MRDLPALLEALLANGVLPSAHRPLCAEAVADALWLARFLGPVHAGTAHRTPEQDIAPEADTETAPPPNMPPLPPPPPAPAAGPAQSADEAPLHVPEASRAHPGAGPGATASSLAVGRPNLLPDPLAIERKLRPLMTRLPSPARQVLDEAATVHRWAEARVPIPVLRGAPERRWELALVVDAHPAFELWAPLIDEFARLLTRHGAFRDVRLWCLGPDRSAPDAGIAAPPVRLWPGPRPAGTGARAPAILRDPRGRRLILIASDFSGPAWRPGPAGAPANRPVLADWQRSQPVALLHLLPPKLWPRTALGSVRETRITAAPAPHPTLPPRLLFTPPPRGKPLKGSGPPLPVLGLEVLPLGAWAQLIAGRPGARLPPAVWLDAAPASPSAPNPRASPPSEEDPYDAARRRLLLFQAGASAPARALAQACTGMPLTLPVVRLVQQTCGIGGGPAAIAELFLSGLLRRLPDAEQPADNTDPLAVLYDYADDVRQLLIDAEPPARLDERLRLVSAAVRRNLGSTQDFLARWLDPEQPPDAVESFTPSQRPFALIRLAVLRRLGGRYAEQIPALADALAPVSISVDRSEHRMVEATGQSQPGAALPGDEATSRPTPRADELRGAAVVALEPPTPRAKETATAGSAVHPSAPTGEESAPAWPEEPVGSEDTVCQVQRKRPESPWAILMECLHSAFHNEEALRNFCSEHFECVFHA